MAPAMRTKEACSCNRHQKIRQSLPRMARRSLIVNVIKCSGYLFVCTDSANTNNSEWFYVCPGNILIEFQRKKIIPPPSTVKILVFIFLFFSPPQIQKAGFEMNLYIVILQSTYMEFVCRDGNELQALSKIFLFSQ